MRPVFQYRGYSIDCAARNLPNGTFGAQAVLTKIGFNPEIAFRALDVFPTEKEAIAYAKQFAEDWLARKA
jgi:hypothetical protein